MKSAPATLAFAVLTAALAAQAGEGITPAAVKDAFAKAYPQAVDVEFETETKDGKTVYEVEFKHQGKEMEALYHADGTLIRTEVEVGLDTLPEPVQKALAKAHPNAKLKEAEKLMKPDGSVFGYEIEFKEGKVETTVEVAVDGTILSTVSETEDD
jgi:uncharacterized membrane protein YkoI